MRPRVLVIDNVDSFTFNVVAELERHVDCEVSRNDTPLPDRLGEKYDGIVISPGPCSPAEAGTSLEVCRLLAEGTLALPFLGVCLGHQTLAYVLGGRVHRAKRAVHGRAVSVTHDGTSLFEGLAAPLEVARYNSLTVEEASLPAALRVTARSSDDGEIMALEHRALPLASVQFHPESHLSEPRARHVFGTFAGWAARAQAQRG